MKKTSNSLSNKPTLFSISEDSLFGQPIRPEETVKMELDDAWNLLGPCFVSTKLDGYRMQIQRNGGQVWLFTRNGQDWTSRFPEVTDAVHKQVVPDQVILDSELLAFDPASNTFLSRTTVNSNSNHHYKVVIFDVLYVNGSSIQQEPLHARLRTLDALILPCAPAILVLANEIFVNTKDELEKVYARCVAEGEEGIILKGANAQYKAGTRNPLRVKVKNTDTVDAVILGFDTKSAHVDESEVTSILIGVYDDEKLGFVSIAKAQKGKMPTKEWRMLCRKLLDMRVTEKPPTILSVELPQWWVRPEIVVEVDGYGREPSQKYAVGLTGRGTGFQLANARLSSRGIREDKNAEDATNVIQFLSMRLAPGHRVGDAEIEIQPPLL